MITYDRLWETMKKRGITQYHLIKREKFSAGQIGRLKNNMTVSTQTLDTLCRLLSCRIEDIVNDNVAFFVSYLELLESPLPWTISSEILSNAQSLS